MSQSKMRRLPGSFAATASPRARSEQPEVLEGLLIDLWQAVELVGKLVERTGPVGPARLLLSIENAELSLVTALSELMQFHRRSVGGIENTGGD
jgi:hypothetical protein